MADIADPIAGAHSAASAPAHLTTAPHTRSAASIHLDRAMALEAADGAATDIASALAAFASEAPENLTDSQYQFLWRGADVAYRAGCYDEAEALYHLLIDHGQGGHGAPLRCIHIQILRGNPEEALRLLEAGASDPEYGVNDHRLKALALLDLKRFENAAAECRLVIRSAPDDVAFVRLLVTALEAMCDSAQLASLEDELGALAEGERFEILVRARLACDDYAGIRILYSQRPSKLTSGTATALADVINTLTRDGKYEKVNLLLEATGLSRSDSPKLTAAALGSFLAQRDLERAGRWLEGAEALLGVDADPILKVRQIQYLCFTLDLERAKKELGAWTRWQDIPAAGTDIIAALLAALGQWEDVVDFLSDRVAQTMVIDYPTFLQAVGHAARSTGRYDDVLSTLERSLDAHAAPGVASMKERLEVEVSLLRALRRSVPGSNGSVQFAIEPSIYASRAALLSNLFSPKTTDGKSAPANRSLGRARVSRTQQDGEGAIVICSDRNYLIGACVAAFSAVRHNPETARSHPVLIVCSEDALELAIEVFDRVAEAADAQISVVPAASILPRGSDLTFRTGWGSFTPGRALSEAAYYRMFAVKHLLERKVQGRAVYIDSDACVGVGLESFFTIDLKGQPLAARPELPKPLIIQAAIKLGVDPARYFNSGVLVFDLAHAALPRALDDAIDFALTRPEMLTFLDQCALNLAFYGRTTFLDEIHNFYVRPLDVLADDVQPVVWHFLEHCKPWDPTYTGGNCQPWTEELVALSQILSVDILRELLSIQFSTHAARNLGPGVDLAVANYPPLPHNHEPMVGKQTIA